MVANSNPFSLLNRPVRKIVESRGFPNPTDPQIEAIPLILKGKNVLLIAPTGTGKTEAAFLPVFSQLVELSRTQPGIKVLYITPLRALNRDILDRLKWWCEKLDIKISVRHGDTSSKERLYQSRSPPDMLITTPETLQAILPGRNMKRHLQGIRWVIVDEVHELADTKRGSQLSLALERLRLLTDSEFQVIGLSATIGSPDQVAQFLVGTNRAVEIIRVPVARFMELEIQYPTPSEEDNILAAALYTHPEVAARLRIIKNLIAEHKAVLLFTNTRSIAEILASRFKVWDTNFPISIHHGSLAKPARIIAETGIKDGELKGLVCTSSLELGIDVGHIDLCIQYMSPRQVTRLLQRVGRSGHAIGRIAKGVIITMDADDALEALVIARRAFKESLEPVIIPSAPLDALVHQIVGLFTFDRKWDFKQLLSLINKAFPYKECKKEDLTKVLQYMHDRYPRLAWVSFEDEVALKARSTKNMYSYYYETLSMIPDQKSYLVVNEVDESPIGILDESFVAEYGDPGVKFIVRGSPWKITNVYGDKIYVKSVDDPQGAIPSWIGEEIPVPFEVAQEVGKLRSVVEKGITEHGEVDKLLSQLVQQYPANKQTIEKSISEIVTQTAQGIKIPTDKRITLEDSQEGVIVNACFGSLVNRTLALLIGHVLSEKIGFTIGVQGDPYRFIIQSGEVVNSHDVVNVIHDLAFLNLEALATEAAIKGRLFKRRMIHVARKFGAVSKFADLSTISLNQLMKSFQGTAIFDEAVKSTIHRDMDLQNLRYIFNEIREGRLEMSILPTGKQVTPITQIGLEKIQRRTSLIAPEKVKYLYIETARARLLNDAKTFICANCWKFTKILQIKDVTATFQCPFCESSQLGMLNESQESVRVLSEKIRANQRLTRDEKMMMKKAVESGRLIAQHGQRAALIMAAKNLSQSDVQDVLTKENQINDHLFELVIDAERQALRKRFW
jgi:ATP-dependent Lhr-like helicase